MSRIAAVSRARARLLDARWGGAASARATRKFLRESSSVPQAQRRDGSVGPLNKQRGFVEYERKPEPYRPPAERLLDYGEINSVHEPGELKRQSARCMDCGTPFCQVCRPALPSRGGVQHQLAGRHTQQGARRRRGRGAQCSRTVAGQGPMLCGAYAQPSSPRIGLRGVASRTRAPN